MGDWEDCFGNDNPDWCGEQEPDSSWYERNKTINEWNEYGRLVKKGEKGEYDRSSGNVLFDISKTIEMLRFDTFKEAMEWAKEHPGEKITRSPDGYGFIKKEYK